MAIAPPELIDLLESQGVNWGTLSPAKQQEFLDEWRLANPSLIPESFDYENTESQPKEPRQQTTDGTPPTFPVETTTDPTSGKLIDILTGPVPVPSTEIDPVSGKQIDVFPTEPPPPGTPEIDQDARFALQQFLVDNELPLTLMTFIENSLVQGWSFDRIVAELRQTPEYQAAYPENALRMENGYEWWSEAAIREYRSQARRLIAEYTGITNVSNSEIANLIANNVGLGEWERKVATWQSFEQWGPAVGQVLASELGYPLDDERLFAFFLADVPTPELDRAFNMALLRGQPAVLGLGVRPEEEADLLRQYGISPEQAFKGYQGIVGEMPRVERLAAIESQIDRTAGSFPPANELFANTSFAKLFRAIQLGDATAQRELQGLMQREVARWQAQGGPAMNQSGALEGLLTDEERNR